MCPIGSAHSKKSAQLRSKRLLMVYLVKKTGGKARSTPGPTLKLRMLVMPLLELPRSTIMTLPACTLTLSLPSTLLPLRAQASNSAGRHQVHRLVSGAPRLLKHHISACNGQEHGGFQYWPNCPETRCCSCFKPALSRRPGCQDLEHMHASGM
jgi:hypothetical protein